MTRKKTGRERTRITGLKN